MIKRRRLDVDLGVGWVTAPQRTSSSWIMLPSVTQHRAANSKMLGCARNDHVREFPRAVAALTQPTRAPTR